jgi:electron transport complex protein RnfE
MAQADAIQSSAVEQVAALPSVAKPTPAWVTDFNNAVRSDNPVLKLVLGLCSVLAISTNVVNALGMSIAATFVMVGSNVVTSLVRNVIPNKVRIPSFIVIIASFVTLTDLLMAAYTPALYESLGIFIPLIVVNCIILARADAFASKNTVGRALADGIGMGVGYTLPLLALGAIREIFGNGTLLGYSLFGSGYIPMVVFLVAAFNKWGGVAQTKFEGSGC